MNKEVKTGSENIFAVPIPHLSSPKSRIIFSKQNQLVEEEQAETINFTGLHISPFLTNLFFYR